MANFFFEIPWWLPTIAAFAGVVLIASGNARLRKPMLRAGLALVAVGVILAAVSYFFDSDREKVIRRTRELLAAVEKNDWDAVGAYLDPKVRLHGWTGREKLVEGGKRYAQTYRVRNIRVVSLSATEEELDIRAELAVWTDQDLMSNLPSRWSLEWMQTDLGWMLREMKLLQVGQESGQSIAQRHFSE